MPIQTQKALQLPAKHAQWELTEVYVPRPGPKEVRVKIMSTGLNPLDWKIQEYGVIVENYPFISGTAGAGFVDEVGAEVTNLSEGDKIVFQGNLINEYATFQQYCLVPAELTAKLPQNISFDQASSIPLGIASVVGGLWNHDSGASAFSLNLPAPWEEGGEKCAGEPAFVIGGSSSTGQIALQVLKLAKYSPIITTASAHNEAFVKSLGATHFIDRTLSPEHILAEVKRIVGGKPLQLVMDMHSAQDTQQLAYTALSPGGGLLLMNPDLIDAALKEERDGKKIVMAYGNVHAPFTQNIGVEIYSRLTEWLRTGVIVPNPVEVVPDGWAGIPGGLERLKKGQVSGIKLAAHPHETP